jgi:4-amino-4-deoxy-L-arabinose transferase-like glycosyltransferase
MDVLTPAWPTALYPALRQIWSRTLFAGFSMLPERPALRSLFVLLALPALLLYPCLQFRLLEPDEGRYAEIPREMLARGDWIVPRLQGEPYLDKPPLMYWLVMLSYKTFGVHDWAARIPPALAVHGCILAVYLFGCRLFGQRRAFRGALILAVTPGLVGVGRLLNLDGLLTLWVTLGLFAGHRYMQFDRPRWAFALCTIACGLGVLTKGPIAVVLVVCPLIVWCWLNRPAALVGHASSAQRAEGSQPTGLKSGIDWRTWFLFFVGILAINLPWYVAIALREPSFAKYFFWQHNLQRFLAPFDHLQPIWYYGPILLGGLIPATLWIVPIIRSLVSGETTPAARRNSELSFCLLAGGFCVLFFSLSGSKLPTYILPAFPPLALAVGVLLDHESRLFNRGQWIIGCVWLALMFVGHWVLMPAYANERSPMREAAIVRQHCGDPAVPVVCFPRQCNSASFYLGRDDLDAMRTKNVGDLINECFGRPRTIIMFTHRHSMEAFAQAIPPHLHLKLTPLADFRSKERDSIVDKAMGGAPWGLSAIAAVEHESP